MFAKAREDHSIQPAELLLLMVISLASPGETVSLDAMRLLTGASRAEVLESLKVLKTNGFIEQLGIHYPLTKRGKALMKEVEGS